MNTNSRFAEATLEIMEAVLEVENIDDALAGGLEVASRLLQAEAGAIWFLNNKTNRLCPVYNIGEVDVSTITIENGVGIEGKVTQSGKTIALEDASSDQRYGGSVFDEVGLSTAAIVCVPLDNMEKIVGCIELINKKDGTAFTKDEIKLLERMASLVAMTMQEKGFDIEEEEHREVLASLVDITKEFQSGDEIVQVLRGINLDIYKNEFLVVLGESGCGKTTLMNIIGGMDSLSSGTLMVDGRDFSKPSDSELTMYRRNFIGYIFQSYNLMPNLTALENVQFIAELVDKPMDSEEAIDKVKLSDRAQNFPSQMSGGQQQRVSIARAIVKNPRLILADEPTAALDYTTSIEVLEVIEDIVKNQGTTVMMVTHNPEIARMADRVIKLRSGKVSSIKRNLNPLAARELVW